ncbi:MAG: DUF5674 family protein [Elusimicrobiota bacterium]
MTIRIVKTPIPLAEIAAMAEAQFGDMVKAVADVEQKTIAIGGELHADEEAAMLEDGSLQENLWGINLYPEKSGQEWIEFDSMINIRPSQGNRSRDVENPELRARIVKIVGSLVSR